MAKHHTAFWILIAGSLLSLLLPWALTRSIGLIDFTNTGPIGDTIGGIAGPILNFTGLIVLYYSLTEQFAANNLQKQSLEEDRNRNDNGRDFTLSLELVDRTVAIYTKALIDYQTEGVHRIYFGNDSVGARQGMIIPYFNTTTPLITALFNQLSSRPLLLEQEAAIAAILASSLLQQVRDMKNIFEQLDEDVASVSQQENQILDLLTKHSISI